MLEDLRPCQALAPRPSDATAAVLEGLRHATVRAPGLPIGRNRVHEATAAHHLRRSSAPGLALHRTHHGSSAHRATNRSTDDCSTAHHLLLRRLALLHQALLIRRHHAHDLLRRALVARLLDVLQLVLLLSKHAARHDLLEAVNRVFDLVRHVNSGALEDADHVRGQARHPEEEVVEACVFAVEASLDQEAVPGKSAARATARLQEDAIPVLWLAKRPAREKTAAAHIRLTYDIEDLQALLARHAARAAEAIAERERRLAWRLKEANLPLPCELVHHFLLDGHLSASKEPMASLLAYKPPQGEEGSLGKWGGLGSKASSFAQGLEPT
mmetsp:Transcript_68573/g.153664  ORF Transcript_68573/g.153664 Transcript_68573/m.153664 type:complete len:327 (+) Transcript_68573:356-1336(+)